MANFLVVDDDELFRELLCTSVERHGHKALAAGTWPRPGASPRGMPWTWCTWTCACPMAPAPWP
jgi:ActR/RegA family two-component response regulator